MLEPGRRSGGAGGDAADGDPARPEVRRLSALAVDPEHDLALLKMERPPLRPLQLRDSAIGGRRRQLLFTGFPIGGVLGLFPATHRAMVAAIAPVAMPSATGRQLDAEGPAPAARSARFPVFQLDATAYPGQQRQSALRPARPARSSAS